MSGRGGKERSTLRRLGRRAVVATVIGFVMTVAIAWASAAWNPAGVWEQLQALYNHKTGAVFWYTTDRYHGFTHRRAMLEPAPPWMSRPWSDDAYRRAWCSSARDHLVVMKDQWPEPFDVKRIIRLAEKDPMWAGVIQDARGWPIPALWCEWSYDATNVKARTGTLPVLRPVSGGIPFAVAGWAAPRALPYRPLWRGLVMDVVVWGGAYFVIASVVGGAQRLIRQRRGVCPECAYDLRGQAEAGCSECGWRREAGLA